ncbi:MAG: hypothetical protein V4751_05985 [Pseudomonadota bacterium]
MKSVLTVNNPANAILRIYFLVVTISLFAGCQVQMTPDRYAVSGAARNGLQQSESISVNVADFLPYHGEIFTEPHGTDRRNSATDIVLVCSPRSGLVIEQINYSDVAEYLRNALVSELELIGAYSSDSTLTIGGSLVSLTFHFHRVAGLASTGGTWGAVLKLSSSNGAELLFEDAYSFEAEYGPSQCEDMVKHFMPSIQYFIEKMVKHPDFLRLVSGKN